MKKSLILWAILIATPLTIRSQDLGDIDFISPFNDGLSAIEKEGKWAFINREGELVIDYRDDLVLTYFGEKSYPVFNSERCLIVKKDDGISYFGFIDKLGGTRIKPQYLNATNFENGLAIILKLHKISLGQNDVLGKKMVDYSYSELAISPNGETVYYLSEKPTHVTLSKDFLKGPPQFRTLFISDGLIAIKNEDKTWSIKKL
jgi:hypothetical protein